MKTEIQSQYTPEQDPDGNPYVHDAENSEPKYNLSIHSNPDARAWAEFWVSNLPNIQGGAERAIHDVDFMQGWFANAMMAMHDHLLSKEK